MANALYDKGREAFASGAINWLSDTIKVSLLGAGYTADLVNDQFYSTAVGSLIGTAVTLANKTDTAGVVDADDITTGTIATGSTVTQAVIWKDTGSNTTSPLIAHLDLTSTPTNGGTITITWDNTAGLKIFKL